MSGEWVQTVHGRYVYDQGDGWIFDHLDQAWYHVDSPPPTIPTGAPAAASRQRFISRLTEWPEDSIFWVRAHPRTIVEEGGALAFVGCLFLFLVGWAARGWVVFTASWTLLHLGGIWRGLRYEMMDDSMDRVDAKYALLAAGEQHLWITALIYLAFALFAFIVLGILSLNAEQSAALTTAFVAHNMYRHFVDDVGRAQVKAAEQYHRTHHGPGGGW